MKHDFDVIVAGGGPAGSSTANFLRQRNRSVLRPRAREVSALPHRRVDAAVLQRRVDASSASSRRWTRSYIHKPGAKFIHEESGAEFTYYFDNAIRPGRPYAYQVKRADFDKMLLDHAASLGAVVREETRVDDVRLRRRRRDRALHRPRRPVVRGARAPCSSTPPAATRSSPAAASSRSPTALITTNVAVHAMFKDVDRSQRRRRGQHHHRPVRRRLVVAHPVQGRRHLRRHGLREGLHARPTAALSPQQMIDAALEHLPAPQAATCATPRRFLDRRRAGQLVAIARSSSTASGCSWSATRRPSSIRCSRRACCSRSTAPSSPPSTSTPRSADGDFAAERFAPYQEQCIAGMDIFKSLVHEFYSREPAQGAARVGAQSDDVRGHHVACSPATSTSRRCGTRSSRRTASPTSRRCVR